MAHPDKEESDRDLIVEELIDLLVRYLEDDTIAGTRTP